MTTGTTRIIRRTGGEFGGGGEFGVRVSLGWKGDSTAVLSYLLLSYSEGTQARGRTEFYLVSCQLHTG